MEDERSQSQEPKPRKYWIELNSGEKIWYDYPLNPGFVFWLKRRFKAKIVSHGGERVYMTRREPFSETELRELYSELEYRQRVVSLPIPKYVFERVFAFVNRAKLSRETFGVFGTERFRDHYGDVGFHKFALRVGLGHIGDGGSGGAEMVLVGLRGHFFGGAQPVSSHFGATPPGRSFREAPCVQSPAELDAPFR